jgi:DUF4097 and DUF4098 domain-containing protein YvlB
MTRGRRAALAIGVPVCLLLIGSVGLSLVADVGEGSYPVSYIVPATTKALTLNVTGRLTIKPTAAARAAVIGTATYSVIRPAVAEHTSADTTTFGYSCDFPSGNCGLDATVTVPATVTTLTAHSGGGDAAVDGMAGPVTLSTGDGNLSARNMSGPLTLNTDSGNIEVSAITSRSTLSTSTGSGDITAAGVTAETITAVTDSGSIVWSGVATAAIAASTGSGDIEIRFSGVPRDVRVNTNNGNIRLLLPPGSTRYRVAANTDSGAVNVTLPQTTSSSSPNVITASSGSGNITISRQ